MEQRLRIRMLGGFAILRRDELLTLPTRKAAALLAILGMRPGSVVARDRLAELLWPRSPAAQARGSLRQALAQLRRALGDDCGTLLSATTEGLCLTCGRVEVDVAELEAALDDGSHAALARAATLCTGELLAGFAVSASGFEDWRHAEAERVRRRTLRGLRILLDAHVGSGDIEAARELAERMLHLDPVSEEVYQSLMRLHLARGAPGAAMREYERCRALLAAQLGVAPSATTEGLRRQIRARSAATTDSEMPARPVVAVLPFANGLDAPEQAYFARGFAEDIIRELTRFRALRVLAAQSSFAEADPDVSPREIGRRLGARYLLTGSLRRRALSLRIGTELLDAETGHLVWSDRHDIASASLFDVQDEIARSVVAALAVRIDGDRLKRAMHKPLENLEAYDCWLRGMECLRAGAPESLADARPLFERALECDPGFARAHSGLSLSYFNDWSCIAWERWETSESRAFEHAQQAVAIDDTDHVTHFVLGRILLYRREFERAERHLRRAEALNPNDADVLAQLACAYAFLGHADEGRMHIRLAMDLNPYHDDWYFAYAAYAHLLARRFDDAIGHALKAPHVATDIHALVAAAYAHLGRLPEARLHVARFLDNFRRRITFGRCPERTEAARWLLHVNPLRRLEDARLWLDGLALAGLPISDDVWVGFPITPWPALSSADPQSRCSA